MNTRSHRSSSPRVPTLRVGTHTLATRALTLSLLLLPTLATAELPDGMLEDMVAFDRAYIPALAHSHNGETKLASRALLTTLERWHKFAADYEEAPEDDRFWAQDCKRIAERLERARLLLEADAPKEAHQELEGVRGVFLEIRQRHGATYYLDGLTRFHTSLGDILETLTDRRPQSLNDTDLEALLHLKDAAQRRWEEATATPPNAELFGLDAAALHKMDEMESDVTEALKAFAAALSRGERARIKQTGLALRRPFAKLYLSFGDFESE